jgi:hypothetical protein
MNNYQLIRMKMYMSLIDFLNREKGNISEMPMLNENLAILTDSVEKIRELYTIQENCRWGSSPEKKERKKALVDLMCIMSARLSLFAKLNKNEVLLAEVRFTPWELSRIRQVQLASPAMTIYDRARKHLAELKEYGITDDLLKRFKEAIDAYSESIPFPRLEKVKSVVATKSIRDAFNSADKALEMLDLLAGSRKYDEPQFWSSYRDYRRLIKSGSVKMALKALAISKTDGAPVSSALFTFVLKKPERKTSKVGFTIRKKTREQGGFYILHIPPGKYEITVTKPGYKEQKWEQEISDKELLKIRVEMEKEES